LTTDKKTILKSVLNEIDYPDVIEEAELGQGSRIKVHLIASAAQKIYGRRKDMTAYGIIADEMREDGEAWPVELDPIDSNGEPVRVVVPADWVEAFDESSLTSKTKKNKKNRKQKNSSNAMDEDPPEGSFEDDDDYEDEEEVYLETVTGKRPKPTPAQGGSVHDDDEDERQHGGAQCAQM